MAETSAPVAVPQPVPLPAPPAVPVPAAQFTPEQMEEFAAAIRDMRDLQHQALAAQREAIASQERVSLAEIAAQERMHERATATTQLRDQAVFQLGLVASGIIGVVLIAGLVSGQPMEAVTAVSSLAGLGGLPALAYRLGQRNPGSEAAK